MEAQYVPNSLPSEPKEAQYVPLAIYFKHDDVYVSAMSALCQRYSLSSSAMSTSFFAISVP